MTNAIPLKHIFRQVTERAGDIPQPIINLEHVESGTGRVVDGYEWEEGVGDQLLRFRAGDILFGKLRPYLRKFLHPDRDGACTGEMLVLRSTLGHDPRFLFWLIQSEPVIRYADLTSEGSKMPRTSWDKLGRLRLRLPGIVTQRAIASHLDRETARLDALIAAGQEMVALVYERLRTVIERRVWWDGEKPRLTRPLRRVAQRIDVGIAEATTHAYADDGVPLLRSTNIRENRCDTSDMLFISQWFADRNRTKYVHAADILTVRTGNVGVSAVVPPELDRSQCFTQLITTVDRASVPEFVCYALNSGRARGYFQSAGWGSAQANISVPLLANAPVPVCDREDQRAIVDDLADLSDRVWQLKTAHDRQVVALGERRRALITAAVAGELEVPGAA